MMPSVVLTIGGRRFAMADVRKCSLEMIEHLRSVLAATEFDRITPRPGELAVDFLNRKADTVLPAAMPFVAAMLLPAGRSEPDWSLAMTRRTERHLATLGTDQRRHLDELARLGAMRLLDAAVPDQGGPNPTTLH